MSRKPSVLFLGSSFWCRHLTGLLNDRQLLCAYTSKDAFRWLLSKNKSICLVGIGVPDTYKRILFHLFAYLMQKTGIINKRVLFWIGSDVTRIRPDSRMTAGCWNIAGSPWLAKEVRDSGYACEERLFPIDLSVSGALAFPQSKSLRVLCYVPDAHHELHGSSEVRALAEHFVNVEFIVIGGDGSWWPDRPGNIRFLGWVDDPVTYLADSHVVLRRTAHDSFSAFVREGLVAGRHVVFTYDVPGVIHVKRGDTTELLARVEELETRFSEGQLEQGTLDPEVRRWLSDVDAQTAALSQDYD